MTFLIIPVLLRDGTEEIVGPRVLDHMLEEKRVAFFRRSGGWVVVGRDPLRGMGGRLYTGRERRAGLRTKLH